jgi:hypothetical protein
MEVVLYSRIDWVLSSISAKVDFVSSGTQQGLLYCALTNIRWVWSHTDMVLHSEWSKYCSRQDCQMIWILFLVFQLAMWECVAGAEATYVISRLQKACYRLSSCRCVFYSSTFEQCCLRNSEIGYILRWFVLSAAGESESWADTDGPGGQACWDRGSLLPWIRLSGEVHCEKDCTGRLHLKVPVLSVWSNITNYSFAELCEYWHDNNKVGFFLQTAWEDCGQIILGLMKVFLFLLSMVKRCQDAAACRVESSVSSWHAQHSWSPILPSWEYVRPCMVAKLEAPLSQAPPGVASMPMHACLRAVSQATDIQIEILFPFSAAFFCFHYFPSFFSVHANYSTTAFMMQRHEYPRRRWSYRILA